VSLSGLALLQGISKTIFATSTDDLRPAMMGVYFQIDTNKISMVATDAHKLVRYVCTDITSAVTSSFIMPKKALNLLKTVVPADAEITLSFNNSYAFFTFNKIKLVCRLIDNKYPDYNAVIPVDNPLSVQISRHDFQNSLKRIAIYANKTTNQVVLNITKGSMTVSAQDLDFSNEAIEQLPCNYDGSPLVIAFNAKFMAEMLGVLDSEEVLKKFVFKTQETLDSSLLKTSFLAINCLPKGEHTICVCKMKDQFEVYDNTFYLKKSSGKWLMDAPPEEAQIYQDEELQKIIDSIFLTMENKFQQ
jgi:DNA polymerase III beta subunit